MLLSELKTLKESAFKILDPSEIKSEDDAHDWADAVDKICASSGMLHVKSRKGSISLTMIDDEVHGANFKKFFEQLKDYGFTQKGDEAWKYTEDHEKAKTTFIKGKTKIDATLEWKQIVVTVNY